MATLPSPDPDRFSEVHVLRRERVPTTRDGAFDEDRVAAGELLRELRAQATADHPWIGVPAAFAVFLALCIGVGLVTYKVDGIWFALTFILTVVLLSTALTAAAQRGNGKVPEHVVDDLINLKKMLREYAAKGDVKLVRRLAEREADLRMNIYRRMRGK